MKHWLEYPEHWEILELTVTQEFLRREERLSPVEFAKRHGITPGASVSKKFLNIEG